jgi:preprotein translocase subunit SecE
MEWPMTRTSPLEFIQQVRSEVAKVVWPSRRETVITSTMVVFMAVATAVFFLTADQVFSRLMAFILTLGH